MWGAGRFIFVCVATSQNHRSLPCHTIAHIEQYCQRAGTLSFHYHKIIMIDRIKKEGLSHREPKLSKKEAMLDELDQQILKSIRENEKPAKVIDIIRPFLGRRSQRALRERLNKLHHLGYIELRKQAYGVLVIRKPEANHSRGEPLYV